MWRLYLLRTWVYADPRRAAEEFAVGRAAIPVAEVVAGLADPPGPDEVRRLVDDVLGGVVRGDYADVLLRAAAFARVVGAGRVALGLHPGRRTPTTCPPRACSPWPTSSTGPRAWSSTTGWADRLSRPGSDRLY